MVAMAAQAKGLMHNMKSLMLLNLNIILVEIYKSKADLNHVCNFMSNVVMP